MIAASVHIRPSLAALCAEPVIFGISDCGPLVVGTRVLVAQSGQTCIKLDPAFVPLKPRSPREAAYLPQFAHISATMANTSEPRSWLMSVA
jgi:hypothetical protein